jgi:hypothetical protein
MLAHVVEHGGDTPDVFVAPAVDRCNAQRPCSCAAHEACIWAFTTRGIMLSNVLLGCVETSDFATTACMKTCCTCKKAHPNRETLVLHPCGREHHSFMCDMASTLLQIGAWRTRRAYATSASCTSDPTPPKARLHTGQTCIWCCSRSPSSCSETSLSSVLSLMSVFSRNAERARLSCIACLLHWRCVQVCVYVLTWVCGGFVISCLR